VNDQNRVPEAGDRPADASNETPTEAATTGPTAGTEPMARPVPNAGSAGMDRRSFLRTTGVGAGALALAGSMGAVLAGCREGVRVPGTGPEVVVVGAGVFGVWTAYHLQAMGARVTLVDLYGPGNSRATSGDETRGVRTSYQGRELWASWAARAIERWEAFDEEWSPRMGAPLFYRTGDVILRETSEGMIEGVREIWAVTNREHELLTADEVRYRWPQISIEGMEVALHEPGAGVVRARAACQRVAAIFQMRGGEIRIGRATPGAAEGSRMVELELDGGADSLSADRYVFALGPWFPSAFPEIMGERIRIPMGNVFYYGTPPGDHRFNFPNLPSWNFPGVTGWPSLPPDHRGFRVRTGGRPGDNPDTSERWIPEEYHERPRQLLVERFPDLASQPVVETRACHYESSSTRDWIIDLHPEMENVWFAGGGSAEGFKFGPMIGELIASRVLENGMHADLDERFRLEPLAQPEEEVVG
jgi:sarcosine oxidase